MNSITLSMNNLTNWVESSGRTDGKSHKTMSGLEAMSSGSGFGLLALDVDGRLEAFTTCTTLHLVSLTDYFLHSASLATLSLIMYGMWKIKQWQEPKVHYKFKSHVRSVRFNGSKNFPPHFLLCRFAHDKASSTTR